MTWSSGFSLFIRPVFIRLQVARWEPDRRPRRPLSAALSRLASGPSQEAQRRRTDSGPAKGGGRKGEKQPQQLSEVLTGCEQTVSHTLTGV